MKDIYLPYIDYKVDGIPKVISEQYNINKNINNKKVYKFKCTVTKIGTVKINTLINA